MVELDVYLSDALVSIELLDANMRRAMQLLWRAANRPLVPTVRRERISVQVLPGNYRVTLGTTLLAETKYAIDVPPIIERSIYDAVVRWNRSRFIAHASCVVRNHNVVLFVGPSGAGKSSLALAAVRRGWLYFSDEYTIYDGKRVWGVPRAIQFQAVAPGRSPPWVAGGNEDAYIIRDLDGKPASQPLHDVLPQQVPSTAMPATRVWLFYPRRGDQGELTRRPLLPALATLHATSWSRPRLNLGGLLQSGRTWNLVWREPSEAITRIEQMVDLDETR